LFLHTKSYYKNDAIEDASIKSDVLENVSVEIHFTESYLAGSDQAKKTPG